MILENAMERLAVRIEGLHCQGCVANVRGVLRALPGVSGVEVSLEKGRAEIDYDPRIARPEQFREAIESAGFDVAPAKTAG